jgi:hypothetical protein
VVALMLISFPIAKALRKKLAMPNDSESIISEKA